MDVFLGTVQSGVAQGLIWAIMTIGVFVTFKLLDFADLTVEGTFPLGAAISVIFINQGMNPILAMTCSFLIGSLAGFVTGVFNTVFKIPPILSGILTMIALYSINLRILGDKATVPISSGQKTVKTMITDLFGGNINSSTVSIIVGVTFCIIITFLLYNFFNTEIGAALRATGSNPDMSRALGINTNGMVIVGLMISNGLVAVAGSLIAQLDYGSAMVSMGQGTIVIGLASVIIGEVIFLRKDRSVAFRIVAVILGAIIYRTIIAFALRVDFLKATDLKIITAVVVSVALALPVIKQKISDHKARKENDKVFANVEGDNNA